MDGVTHCGTLNQIFDARYYTATLSKHVSNQTREICIALHLANVMQYMNITVQTKTCLYHLVVYVRNRC